MIISLDYGGDIPIYQQLRNQIVLGIASGALGAGEKLPTIRALATELGINMMTVSRAYQMLKQEGYIASDRRSGAWVAINTDQAAVLAKLKETLRLTVAEARLAGLGTEDLTQIIQNLYQESEG
ncbi:MAG: GntR family transcriptional regulator [Oscillospiraceae bacterium]|nr:GntR family transcriptional regulator [Oscillospiraceae bacterium]